MILHKKGRWRLLPICGGGSAPWVLMALLSTGLILIFLVLFISKHPSKEWELARKHLQTKSMKMGVLVHLACSIILARNPLFLALGENGRGIRQTWFYAKPCGSRGRGRSSSLGLKFNVLTHLWNRCLFQIKLINNIFDDDDNDN